MRLAPGAVALALACALSACGASARAEVQAKLQQFVHATASGDYRTLCRDVLAQSLIDRLASTGNTCQHAMQIFLQSVQDPTLSVGKLTVQGHNATALTLTTARGQRSTVASVQLVETSNGWRVSSLGPSAGGSG
ncbi:MAG TPA: hypothetical protein VIL82_04465 [Solirubrobacteraceae bacterium]|jgi:hypothetical protein